MRLRLIILLMLVMCISAVNLAAEGQKQECYQLVSGKKNEMCTLFQANLNRFCSEPPMVCERKVHPNFAKLFSFPQWEQVAPEKHLDVIADYIRVNAPQNAKCPNPAPVVAPKKGDMSATSPMSEGDIRANEAAEQCQAEWREKKWQEYREGLLERMKAGQVSLSRARFNIKGYGEKEFLVYRLVDWPCSSADRDFWDNPQVPKLIVFDETTSNLDRDYTQILSLGGHYDVILHKGKSHLIAWGRNYGIDRAIWIYQPPYAQCLYRYTGKEGASK